MTKEELEFNRMCSEFRYPNAKKEYEADDVVIESGLFKKALHALGHFELMKYHSDWNWIMEVAEQIVSLGFRKYTQCHEKHSRWVFTDMSILYQNHEFGGGDIVADSGECGLEKEAAVNSIKQFLIWYNTQKTK